MDSRSTGDLVKVAGTGAELDGIVFDSPSAAKVVVAIVDPARGPVLRTFPAKALSDRADEVPADRALRALIKRTPAPVRGGARGGAGAVSGRAGHTRATMHRTTGK